ncbi:uncharacterized protein P884DRAFT_263073 [Thermothelomyces heterothallicus CBS 202.75]|uniref:uncharacterized protein n=1 Tax=Thermothelomyces heterothallicus CBS 202.75 TaxID=1149848 RepID=UPI003742DE91
MEGFQRLVGVTSPRGSVEVLLLLVLVLVLVLSVADGLRAKETVVVRRRFEAGSGESPARFLAAPWIRLFRGQKDISRVFVLLFVVVVLSCCRQLLSSLGSRIAGDPWRWRESIHSGVD